MMDLLFSLVALALSLLITTWSVRLAAGWLEAEHRGWLRCLGTYILANIVAILLIAIGVAVFSVMPGAVGALALVVTALAAIFGAIVVFARLLGTTKVRALGIVVISTIVAMAINFGLMMVLGMVFGVGLLGLGGLSALMPGSAGGDADETLAVVEAQVAQLCACPDDACVASVMPDLMGELMSASMTIAMAGGDPETDPRLSAIVERMESCEPEGGLVMDEPGAMPPADVTMVDEGEVMTSPDEPVAAATNRALVSASASRPAVSAPPKKLRGPLVPYAMREVPIGEAGAHIGKLVRITQPDGERFSDQLVGIGAGRLILKRDRAAGGERYEVRVPDVGVFEVFDQG